MFKCLLGEVVRRAEDEHVTLIQNVMERSMRKESLLCELYLQLIKQTTEHPDPNSRVNLRHWALLSLTCSVVLPPQRSIRKYLIAHLRKCAGDCVTEEGKYARFAEKVCTGKVGLDFCMGFHSKPFYIISPSMFLVRVENSRY